MWISDHLNTRPKTYGPFQCHAIAYSYRRHEGAQLPSQHGAQSKFGSQALNQFSTPKDLLLSRDMPQDFQVLLWSA